MIREDINIDELRTFLVEAKKTTSAHGKNTGIKLENGGEMQVYKRGRLSTQIHIMETTLLLDKKL